MKSKHKQGQTSNLRESKTIKICLVILVVIAIGFIFHILQSVFKPLFIALFLSYIFEPLIKLMRKIKIPKLVAILFVFVITFILFYLIGLIIYSNVNTFTTEFPKYQNKLALTSDLPIFLWPSWQHP